MQSRIFKISLCLLAVLLLVGCAKDALDAETQARIEDDTRGMIDCILADDLDGAYGYVQNATTKENFSATYATVREMLADVESYTLSRLETDASDGFLSLSLRMDAAIKKKSVTYLITASEKEGVSGLYTFYIQKNAPTPVGAITRMGEANALQWCFTVFGGLCWLFTLAAAIDCGLHAKKNKGMMLFIILFAFATFSFTVSPEFSFSVTHGYRFPYSALLFYETGEQTAKLFLPLGAIGYFLLRRRFVHPDKE